MLIIFSLVAQTSINTAANAQSPYSVSTTEGGEGINTSNSSLDPRSEPYTSLQKNGPDGTAETNLNLGTPIRDDNGVNGDQTTGDCIQMGGILLGSQTLKDQNGKILYPNGQQVSPTRRIGTCQDGIYTLKTRHIDTAGNIGEWTSKQIERDTVSPLKPKVELSKTGDILGEFLSVKISGEATAKASIEITNNSSYQTAPKQLNINLDINGNFNASNTIGQLTCGNITYTVKTTLTDRAGNISETTTQTIQTAECPTCGSTGNGSFILPIKTTQFQISGEFPRYQITSGLPHAGIDFAANSDTPVLAAQAGTIKRAIFSYTDNYGKEDPFNVTSGWANTVIIEHNLPNQPTIQTIYGHLAPNNISNLKEGDTVQQGQVIGLLGSTGSSSGFHLHFQVEVQGSTLNPIHEGKYNKYPPQNPRNYLGDITTNLNQSQQEVYCKFETSKGGNSENPWGTANSAEDLGEFKLTIKKDQNGNITKELQPNPKITYIRNSDNSQEIKAYGLGIYKLSNMFIEVKEQKEVCTGSLWWKKCEQQWQDVYQSFQNQETVEHAEIQIVKENNEQQIAQLWNDNPPYDKGKWETSWINLSQNQINFGDKICPKTKLYGKLDSNSNTQGKWYESLDYGWVEGVGGCERILNTDLNYCKDFREGKTTENNYENKCGTMLESKLIDLPNSNIVFRSSWGWKYTQENANPEIYNYFVRDKEKPINETVSAIVIHHTTDSQNQSIQELEEKEHIGRNNFKPESMPYHFIIKGDGTIYEGRPLEFVGDHVSLQNHGKIGIAIMGDFEPRLNNLWKPDKPTDQQLNSLKKLTDDLEDFYKIDPNSDSILGHKSVTGQQTECPGDELDKYINEIISYAKNN